LWSNGRQPDLDRARVVESPVGAEVHMQALRQRREALHSLAGRRRTLAFP
jgi:hypothetical protein